MTELSPVIMFELLYLKKWLEGFNRVFSIKVLAKQIIRDEVHIANDYKLPVKKLQ